MMISIRRRTNVVRYLQYDSDTTQQRNTAAAAIEKRVIRRQLYYDNNVTIKRI